MTQPLSLVFAGTPEFAVPALRRLISGPHEVAAVYTQPDRPAGRGRKVRPSPVKQCAQAAGIPVRQPITLRDPAVQAMLREMRSDAIVVVAYGLILPQAVLDMPRLGCLNIHASLLPRWRGAAPIQRAMLAGDSTTGVSIMRMEAGLDTGPVIASRACPIKKEDTAGTLHDRLAIMGAELLVDSLEGLASGGLAPVPQDCEAATYAEKIDKGEAMLNWTGPAEVLARQVRAFNPWPIASVRFKGSIVRVWDAEPGTRSTEGEYPGTVLAAERDAVEVATGAGTLRLLRLQWPGGRPLACADALNGHPIRTGDRFE